MYETTLTIVGNVATEPQLRATSAGVKVANFRVGCTERRFDRKLDGWRDGDTVFWSVSCWRALAENVVASVVKGQPIVVHGRVRANSYEDKQGVTRTQLEIDAFSVGHDLTRGVSAFTKASVSSRDAVIELESVQDDSAAAASGWGLDDLPAAASAREEASSAA